jgi:hypothetical protein
MASPQVGAAEGRSPGVGGAYLDGGDPTAVAREADGEPGASAHAAPADCLWTVLVSDDRRTAVFDEAGNRTYSETGRWLQMICNGSIRWVDGWPLIPEQARVDARSLALEALRSVQIGEPVVATSPDASRPSFVRVPTWLWVDRAWWHSYEATATAGRVSATVTARPVRTVWSTDDGGSETCAGPGTVWRPGMAEDASSCRHVYERSSATQPARVFRLHAAVELEVTWTSNVGASGRLPSIRREAELPVRVEEIQTVRSGGA